MQHTFNTILEMTVPQPTTGGLRSQLPEELPNGVTAKQGLQATTPVQQSKADGLQHSQPSTMLTCKPTVSQSIDTCSLSRTCTAADDCSNLSCSHHRHCGSEEDPTDPFKKNQHDQPHDQAQLTDAVACHADCPDWLPAQLRQLQQSYAVVQPGSGLSGAALVGQRVAFALLEQFQQFDAKQEMDTLFAGLDTGQ